MSYTEPSEWDETEEKVELEDDNPSEEVTRDNVLAVLNRGTIYHNFSLESLC